MFQHTGSKYEISRDIKDVAKLVRQDIKRLHPGVRASVRIERYSMGQSLTIRVKGCGFNPLNPDCVNWGVFPRLTDAGRSLLDSLTGIANAYNRREIDSMSDYYNVNFHCSVGYDSDFKAGCIAEILSVKSGA